MKLIGALLALLGYIAVIVLVSGFSAYFTMIMINYVFGAAFMSFVFGGFLTFWKAWVFNILIGGLLASAKSNSGE